MKKQFRTSLGCGLLAAFAFLASCEKSQGDEVFETLEQQNALLVEQNYQAIPGSMSLRFNPARWSPPKFPQEPPRTKGRCKTVRCKS